MGMSEHDPKAQARDLLARFRSLSPVLVQEAHNDLLALAPDLGSGFFPELEQFTRDLIAHYLQSPVKRNEHNVMREYLGFIDRQSRKLIAAGELQPPPDTDKPDCVALVPQDTYTSQQWCQLTEKVEMPLIVANAVDAAKRRNYLIESVLEPLFDVMLAIDREQALSWQLSVSRAKEQALDPDIARDLLRVWRQQHELPPAVLERVLEISEDEKTFRHWPAVIDEADRLLRRHALQAILAEQGESTTVGRQLRYLAPFRDSKRLNRWMRQAIDKMGASIDFFVSQSEQDLAEPWRQDALFAELQHLDRLIPPLLICSDLLLLAPTGSYDFAMAVFGFTSAYEQSWEAALEEQSKQIIRRMFLRDLRANRSPERTIKRLCFGNEELHLRVLKELDYFTHNFDSLSQRELVIDKLSGTYSSFRKQPLLHTEIGRRYRRMMRVLHEDNLHRLLREDQVSTLQQGHHVLLDLSVIASESRRYLAMRRALDRTTAEVVAADMDFTQSIRGLRASYIRRYLDL